MTHSIGFLEGNESFSPWGASCRVLPAVAPPEVATPAADRDVSWWSISHELMFVTAPDGRLLRANLAWREALGWSDEQLSSDVLSQIEHPADRSVRQRLFEDASGDPTAPLCFETRLGTSDGRWLKCLCRVWRNLDGCMDWAAHDITAERGREDALAEMQRLLRQERMIAELGRMAAGVMHDINNLLQVIGGSAERLRKERLDDGRDSRYLDAIKHATERGRMLTARLSHLSRRERSTAAVFDVADTLTGLKAILATILGERIDIVLDLSTAPCMLHADPVELEAAVINLAVNARDAMACEGRLSIGLRRNDPSADERSLPPGASMSLSIADTGPGIAAENRHRIFEPFFTTKPVGKGSGIGLAQVLDFARECRGEVAVESIVGQGTTITLHLPAVEMLSRA